MQHQYAFLKPWLKSRQISEVGAMLPIPVDEQRIQPVVLHFPENLLQMLLHRLSRQIHRHITPVSLRLFCPAIHNFHIQAPIVCDLL